ncbi:MAG: hypothetical protein ACTS22_08535 [Phycisphaerales bacterium]
MSVSRRMAAAVLVSTVSAISAAGQCFRNGEILMYATQIPDGTPLGLQGIVGLDPETYSTRVIYSTTQNFQQRIAYEPSLNVAVLKPGSVNELHLINAFGELATISVDPPNMNYVATSPFGLFYVTAGAPGDSIEAVDYMGNRLPITDAFGAPLIVFGSRTIQHLFYHAPSSSLYYISDDNSAGFQQTFLSRVEMVNATTSDATFVDDITQFPLSNGEETKNISHGRTDNEIYIHRDVNDNDLHTRASVIDTTFTPFLSLTPYFESGFFRAAATDVSIYSPVTDSAITWSVDGYREYEFGDVDVVGAPLAAPPSAFAVFDMANTPGRPCLADTNGNGVADPGDFTAWLVAYNDDSCVADQNEDGVISAADFTAWTVNYNAGC